MINDYPQTCYLEDYSLPRSGTEESSSSEEDEEVDVPPSPLPEVSRKKRGQNKKKKNQDMNGKMPGLKRCRDDEATSSDSSSEEEDSPVKIVHRKPEKKVSPANKLKKKKRQSTESDEERTSEDMDFLKDPKRLVSELNGMGRTFVNLKTGRQKLAHVNQLTKGQMRLFHVLISNIFAPNGQKKKSNHCDFQLSPEELRRFEPYAKHFKDFLKARTPFKRKVAILQEGHILKYLSDLMTQLEVDE